MDATGLPRGGSRWFLLRELWLRVVAWSPDKATRLTAGLPGKGKTCCRAGALWSVPTFSRIAQTIS